MDVDNLALETPLSEECIFLVGFGGHQCLAMTQKSRPRNRWLGLLRGNLGGFL